MSDGKIQTDLKDKVVLVTGGTRGIGAKIVEKFAEIGAISVFIGRNKIRGEKLQAHLLSLGLSAKFIQADLLDSSQCENAIHKTIEFAKYMTSHERIDVLVNCAGNNDNIAIGATRKQISDSLDLNLGQYIHMTSLVWPYLIKNKGNIINIGSKTGKVGQKGSWAYSAANGGIMALTKASAKDGVGFGIRVNCVNPAEVDGEHYREWAKEAFKENSDNKIKEIGKKIPLYGRMSSEDEIANSVLFLASSLANHMTGKILEPDGGYPELLE